jgi:HEAT repeat protein
VIATKDEIAVRVDALAAAYEGDEFVAAVSRFAEELGPDDLAVLQDLLLERAADEEDFQEALRARAAAKGWTRRTLARIDGLLHQDRSDPIADAIEAGPDGEERLAREVELLHQNRGKAALALDALSRDKNPVVRAWVPGTAADVLDDGASRLVLSMTRDRDRTVRTEAVSALVRVDPDAARKAVPDLRKRLHAKDEEDRIAAMGSLAEIGDESALAVIEERAATAESMEERRAAEAAVRTLRGSPS